ncbi:MAG: hypothetical protein Q4F54_01160 [Coriobacteriia bacterium]|nr:hypothetical protein [Coriobacteriia bacterium]
MIEAYDDFIAKYAANMPPEIPDGVTDKYGQINFEVVNPSNTLMLAKDTVGTYADKTKKFEMSLVLHNPDGTIYAPPDTFTGKLYRVSGTEATLDIHATVNSSGEVLISESQAEPYTYKYPDLANGDYIVIYSILPPNGGSVLG